MRGKRVVVAVAVGVLGVMAGFAISPADAPAVTPRTELTAAESGDGVNLTAGAHIEYANDGSGDYWTVNTDGEFCPMCGPGRGGSGHFVEDLSEVTASPAGPLGRAVVTSASWPVAPSETAAKVVRAGTGRTIDALADKIAVRYVVVNPETGAAGEGAVMYAADAVDIPPAVAGALTGERVGSRLLIAVPGSGSAKADLYLLDITGSTTLATPTPTGGNFLCSPSYPAACSGPPNMNAGTGGFDQINTGFTGNGGNSSSTSGGSWSGTDAR